MKNTFCSFTESHCTALKEFPNAANIHINGFPKAAGKIVKAHRLLQTYLFGPSCFKKLFYGCMNGSQNLFNQQELDNFKTMLYNFTGTPKYKKTTESTGLTV